MGSHIWAPELHRINDKWYIYFTAGDSEQIWDIRPYLLECSGNDPMSDDWTERGRIILPEESFSLDMTTFVHKGVQYCAWAQKGREYDGASAYLSRMKDPHTLDGEPILLTAPEYDWECQGFKVNELLRRRLSGTEKLLLHTQHLIPAGVTAWVWYGQMRMQICLTKQAGINQASLYLKQVWKTVSMVPDIIASRLTEKEM